MKNNRITLGFLLLLLISATSFAVPHDTPTGRDEDSDTKLRSLFDENENEEPRYRRPRPYEASLVYVIDQLNSKVPARQQMAKTLLQDWLKGTDAGQIGSWITFQQKQKNKIFTDKNAEFLKELLGPREYISLPSKVRTYSQLSTDVVSKVLSSDYIVGARKVAKSISMADSQNKAIRKLEKDAYAARKEYDEAFTARYKPGRTQDEEDAAEIRLKIAEGQKKEANKDLSDAREKMLKDAGLTFVRLKSIGDHKDEFIATNKNKEKFRVDFVDIRGIGEIWVNRLERTAEGDDDRFHYLISQVGLEELKATDWPRPPKGVVPSVEFRADVVATPGKPFVDVHPTVEWSNRIGSGGPWDHVFRSFLADAVYGEFVPEKKAKELYPDIQEKHLRIEDDMN